MIVSILQENLNTALTDVLKAVDSNPPLPILANVLLVAEDSSLYITGTNLELSITARIGAKVEKPGSITLPAKTFKELVAVLSKERIDLRLDPETWTVELRCGIQTANLRGIDPEEFPPVNHREAKDVQVEGEVLRSMIVQTAFCAARGQDRPILTGVYMCFNGSVLTMAAADGYRLAVREATIEGMDFQEKWDMVVPAKTLADIGRAIGNGELVNIALPKEKNSVTFSIPNEYITTQLLEGRFPEYATIIPSKTVINATCYTNDLLIVAQRAQIFARDNANSAEISIQAGANAGEPAEVVITGKSAERGDSEGMLDATVDAPDGSRFKGHFNIKYLVEALRVIPDERVVLGFNEVEHPATIRPEGRDGYVGVIMPMS